jgi:hypothetical protein
LENIQQKKEEQKCSDFHFLQNLSARIATQFGSGGSRSISDVTTSLPSVLQKQTERTHAFPINYKYY